MRRERKMISSSKSWLCIPAALAISLVISQPAKAQNWDFRHFGPDFTGAVAIGAVVLITDLCFVVYDFSMAAKGQIPGNGEAIAEIIISLPQVALGTAGIVSTLRYSNGTAALLVGTLTLLPVAMTIHGIHSLATPKATRQQIKGREVEVDGATPESAVLDRVLLRPTLVLAQRGAAPGLSLSLQF